MASRRSVCLFCGSRFGHAPVFKDAAAYVGRTVAERGWRLVYGGGAVGLMGVAAEAALKAGGDVIGVIPDFLRAREVGHAGLTDLIVTDGMHDRKQIMFNLATAFVVLPGGVGTMDETIEILTWKQLGNHRKPIVVVDLEGYWGPLLGALEAAVQAGFMSQDTLELLQVVDSVDAAMAIVAETPLP
ncbi:MAG: TIGR00730 family Rossman fold protein [Alphaproteobacteria bacterium]